MGRRKMWIWLLEQRAEPWEAHHWRNCKPNAQEFAEGYHQALMDLTGDLKERRFPCDESK